MSFSGTVGSGDRVLGRQNVGWGNYWGKLFGGKLFGETIFYSVQKVLLIVITKPIGELLERTVGEHVLATENSEASRKPLLTNALICVRGDPRAD